MPLPARHRDNFLTSPPHSHLHQQQSPLQSNHMTTLEHIKAIVANVVGYEVDDIEEDALLSDELSIDSLDIIDLYMQVEDTFDVDIDEDAPIRSVGQLAAYVDEQIALEEV
jgi:acyl carrier protein